MRTKDAREIRAGITYARQVLNRERTKKHEPDRYDPRTPWTPFNLAYWHTMDKPVKAPKPPRGQK